jgi:hypothetical protein
MQNAFITLLSLDFPVSSYYKNSEGSVQGSIASVESTVGEYPTTNP